MECQSTAGPGAAPAGVAACVMSASPLEVGWPGPLVTEDHREVSPLAREGMLSVGGTHLLSAPLGGGLRLLPDPTPAALPATLARGFPSPRWCARQGGQQGCHVPPMYPGGSGRVSTPVARHLRRRSSEPPDLATCPFGPSGSAASACPYVTTLTTLHLG